MLPEVPRDALVQAVVQGMIVAFGFAAIVFAALGVVGIWYVDNLVKHMKNEILVSVTGEAKKAMKRITANAMHRLGYFEWQQSHVSTLPQGERKKALDTAISDAETAYDILREAGAADESELRLMATIRNNLAWYYAESGQTDKAGQAIDHARFAAENWWRDEDRKGNWLFTKAHVLSVFARNCDEAREAVWTYDLILSQYGHLPEVSQKVAERRPQAKLRVTQLCQGFGA